MKKIGFMTLLITASLLLTLAFPAAAAAPKAPATPAPVVAAAPAAAMPAPPPHPHIHEALEAMHAAKHQLEIAEHDFDGHRLESIKHLDMAIHEAEICEQR
jgi:3-oxoacyl-ACP reductase-like protein